MLNNKQFFHCTISTSAARVEMRAHFYPFLGQKRAEVCDIYLV